jgi:hypothetical protein
MLAAPTLAMAAPPTNRLTNFTVPPEFLCGADILHIYLSVMRLSHARTAAVRCAA